MENTAHAAHFRVVVLFATNGVARNSAQRCYKLFLLGVDRQCKKKWMQGAAQFIGLTVQATGQEAGWPEHFPWVCHGTEGKARISGLAVE